jgi:hypothetical protein
MITWGQLAKSQTDPEKIEEAIQRLINEHNADPEAHLVEGGSLKSHKMAEIIDHLIESIIADKIKAGEINLYHMTSKKRILMTSFESLDGWGTTGSVYLDLGNCAIWTTSTSGNFAEIDAVPSNWTAFDVTKEFEWQATVQLATDTFQEAYFGPSGHPDVGGENGVGFRVLNGDLYVFLFKDGSFSFFQISGINVSVWNVYRIVHKLNPEKYEFWINGELKLILDSDLPTSSDDFMAIFYIKTTTNARRKLYISDFLFSIEK